MENIIRTPDDMEIICEEQAGGGKAEVIIEKNSMLVQVCAQSARVKRIVLRWNFPTRTPVRIMGDKWERAYGDMTWGALNGEIFMPWYFLASDGTDTVGYGV